MGKVHTVGGIGFSEVSGTKYIDMAAVPSSGGYPKNDTPAKDPKSTQPIDYTEAPWSYWGDDNLLPQQMITDIESCGILNAIIDGKARFALSDGMVPAKVKSDNTGKRVIEKIYDDTELIDFLEVNNHFFHTFGWMKDQCGFGNGIARIMLNGEKNKVALFQRDDITEIRLEKKDDKGRINNVYYNANWDLVTSKTEPFKIPLLNPNNPIEDLRKKASEGIVEHAISFKYPGWGKHYYSVPLWWAAYKWVKIAQAVPEMKAAMYENSMRIKYMVIIYDAYWPNAYSDWNELDDDKKNERKNEFYDKVDALLVGSKNSHKSIFAEGKITLDGKLQPFIEVKVIEDTTKTGEYLPDSAAANSEIAFSMLFNPAIIGASLPSGPYTNSQGGSNVRESVLMQIILHELERKNVQRVMNVIKYFNGWDVKYPGLQFIIPATALTTLDTGAGSKPIVTGGAQPGQNNNNGTDQNNTGS